MRFLASVLTGLGLLVFSTPVLAEDPVAELVEGCAAPCVSYELSTELQNDWIFAADPSFLTSDVLQPTLTADLLFAPTDYLQLETSIITEPVVDSAPGENTVLEGIGTYVAELYTVIEAGPATTRAGKFDTIFSLASEVAPGINATELVSDFDADERLGGEIVLRFENLGLNHALAATAFTTDRTILSESLFTNRGRASLSDGGAGNTKGVSSFSVTLDGCEGSETADCYLDGEFGYRFGFRYQRAGHPTEEDIEDDVKLGDEIAYLAAATKSFELDEMTLRLLGEMSYLRHFDGRQDDALVVTGSAALDVDSLTYIATYTEQTNLVAGGPDTRDYLADFEVIYSSDDNTPFVGSKWQLAAAYTFARNADHENAHILSVRAVFDFSGGVEFGR
ncbi:conserved exported hypothetical protein [Mesorhizobium prunaredense]|uniref:Porin n=1 Tax=Mesorhizobium prunaredense TaxID=1631249 RepID=A0A1R3VKW5_9HYPH|nr:hypothetical protein [Mesorhizobium prunaredense]SIT59924.1 conserved exported hypothetical protein [Mesorhizobium prunaredense]